MQDPVVAKIASHIERVGAHGVPAVVRSAVITFVADTLAVGIAGLAAPWRPEILDMLSSIGGPGESTVFGSGERLPLMHAAMLNAYQIHSQEFDCLHENAVVHPMAAVLPVLLGWAEREGGVSGALLIRATAVAVDVAVALGLCSRAAMRFFRSANAQDSVPPSVWRCWQGSMPRGWPTPSAFITGNVRARCRRMPKGRRSWLCRWALPHAAPLRQSSSLAAACQVRVHRLAGNSAILLCSKA
jgi:hypothetical protein